MPMHKLCNWLIAVSELDTSDSSSIRPSLSYFQATRKTSAC